MISLNLDRSTWSEMLALRGESVDWPNGRGTRRATHWALLISTSCSPSQMVQFRDETQWRGKKIAKISVDAE